VILIGERINGMFQDVKSAIASRDKTVIQNLAIKQTEAGADYLDVNVGTSADPEGVMQWLVETVEESCKTPLSIDSQKPAVVEAALKVLDSSKGVLLNSSPLNRKTDEEILSRYIAMAKSRNGKLIALAMDKGGVPQSTSGRVEIAAAIVEKALAEGFSTENLFIDPIILPVNVPGAQAQPGFILEALMQIRLLSDPAPHTTVGLSNVSQGTSERSLINRTFLVMAIAAGLDSAILDVFDKELVDAVATAEMLLNKQIYSDSFLKAFRSMRR